jgi:fibronectin type 3 domain-containing protein
MTETPPVRLVAALATGLLVAVLAANGATATDLFVKPAGSGTACVQSAPCALATALATAVKDDTIYVGAGTYTGPGTEVVLLDRTVNLLGGWNGAASGPIVRDHVVWGAILDGENARRCLKITGPSTHPLIDGLTMTRGNATGLTAGCAPQGASKGCGGAVLVSYAAATISDCHISGSVADSSALTSGSASGGGISAAFTHDLVIRDSTISGNTASTANQGFGGGVAVEYSSAARIEGNRIISNTGASGAGQGGLGGGVALYGEGSTVTLKGNLVEVNKASASDPTWSLGNALYTLNVTVAATANFFASAAAGDAVHLGASSCAFTGNRVEATGATAAAFDLQNGRGEAAAVMNNVLVGGSAATVVAQGADAHPITAILKHNTIVGNGAATGVLAGDSATVTMVNNIVAGHSTGLSTAGTGSLVADHTLFWRNDNDGIRGTGPVDGDPRFVNRAFGDFHVFEGSAAQGHGADAGVAADMDGDARPGLGGIDIGADELAPGWFDFGTPASPVAAGYTRVTPATVYTPALGFGWTSGSIAARDRLQPDAVRRDLCFTPLGTFAVDVPNGRYRVTATVGDQTTGHGQMGFFLEGEQAGSVSTQAGEFVSPSYEVSVTDGQLTLVLDDLGGSDPNVVINALIVLRMPGIWLDLGTASSPVEGGWTRVTPASLYSPAAGAGWLGGTVQARDRGIGTALLRDFNFTRRAYFMMFLQDNVYDVSLTYGDATGAHDTMAVALQAQGMGSVSTAANQFVTRTYPACVVNNLLRIYLADGGGKDPNLVLNTIALRPRAQPFFDFGTATSPVAEGYIQVTPATAYEAWRGYGWTAGTLSSRDRATADPLARDFVCGAQAEFAVDLLDGVYDVQLTMGDATSPHDAMAVTLEGTLVDTVSTPAGPAGTRSYRVRVTGGQLNLALADQGGRDLNVVINGLGLR